MCENGALFDKKYFTSDKHVKDVFTNSYNYAYKSGFRVSHWIGIIKFTRTGVRYKYNVILYVVHCFGSDIINWFSVQYVILRD